jgi:hypothetical protein
MIVTPDAKQREGDELGRMLGATWRSRIRGRACPHSRAASMNGRSRRRSVAARARRAKAGTLKKHSA